MIAVYKEKGNYFAADPRNPSKRVALIVRGRELLAPNGKRVAKIGVLPLAAAAAVKIAPALISLAPKLAAFAKKVKGLLNKLGIGGVSDERFFARYDYLRNLFVANKYLIPGEPWNEEALTRNKIRRTQVKNKGDNFTAEFQRLRKWVIDVMNNANPGLGTDYGQIFTSFKMANQGQIYSANVDVIKAIVEAIPPGNYISGTLQEVVNLGDLQPQPAIPDGPEDNLAEGYMLIKDAAGNLVGIRDAAGKMLDKNSAEYAKILAQAGSAAQPEVLQAGFDMKTIGIGLAALAVIGLATAGKSNRRR